MKAACALAGTLALAAAGCASPRYINADVHTVAVLMPFEQTGSAETSREMWPYIEKAVNRRGYRLVPRPTVEDFYKKNRFAFAGEINQYSSEELARALGADGVVYADVTQYNSHTLNVQVFTKRVALEAWLRDGKTGAELWRGEGSAGTGSAVSRLFLTVVTLGSTGLESLSSACVTACRKCFESLPLPGFDPKRKPPAGEPPRDR